jgi:hypothetical protein
MLGLTQFSFSTQELKLLLWPTLLGPTFLGPILVEPTLLVGGHYELADIIRADILGPTL